MGSEGPFTHDSHCTTPKRDGFGAHYPRIRLSHTRFRTSNNVYQTLCLQVKDSRNEL